MFLQVIRRYTEWRTNKCPPQRSPWPSLEAAVAGLLLLCLRVRNLPETGRQRSSQPWQRSPREAVGGGSRDPVKAERFHLSPSSGWWLRAATRGAGLPAAAVVPDAGLIGTAVLVCVAGDAGLRARAVAAPAHQCLAVARLAGRRDRAVRITVRVRAAVRVAAEELARRTDGAIGVATAARADAGAASPHVAVTVDVASVADWAAWTRTRAPAVNIGLVAVADLVAAGGATADAGDTDATGTVARLHACET